MFKNIQELFLASASSHRKRTAMRMIQSGTVREYKYGDMARLTYEMASRLAILAKRANCVNSEAPVQNLRIAIVADNHPNWVLAAMAIMRLRCIVVAIDPQLSNEDILRIVEESGAVLVLAGRRHEVRLKESTFSRRVLDKLILLDELEESQEPLSADAPSDMPVSRADDDAVIFFPSRAIGDTSGSITFSHRNIVGAALSSKSHFEIQPDFRFLSILSLANPLEFVVGMLSPLCAGATVVYSRLRGTRHLRELMKVEKISVLVTTQQITQTMLSDLEATAEGLSTQRRLWLAASRAFVSLVPQLGNVMFPDVHRELGGKVKFIINTGQSHAPEASQRLQSFGIPVLNTFSIPEAAGLLASETIKAKKTSSRGIMLPGIYARILKQSKRERSGVLSFRSTNISRCVREWLDTPFEGHFDSDGHLIVTGRVGDAIITPCGFSLFPKEVEQALVKAPFVKEACVFGRSQQHGEEPVAVVVAKPGVRGEEELEQRILNQVQTLIEPLTALSTITNIQVWQKDLPRRLDGSINKTEVMHRFDLNECLDGERNADDSMQVDFDEDGRKVCFCVYKVMDKSMLKGRTFEASASLFRPRSNLSDQLGLDSLARLELSSRLEQEFGFNIEAEALNDLDTLEELIAMVKLEQAKVENAELKRVSGMKGPGVDANYPKGSQIKPWPERPSDIFLESSLSSPFIEAGRSFIALTLKSLLTASDRLEIIGEENLPSKPPYLLAVNWLKPHQIAALIASFPQALRKHVRPVVPADTFFCSRAASYISSSLLDAVPFDRTGDLESGIDDLSENLDNEAVLIVFPEIDAPFADNLGPFKPGFAHLAIKAHCPIVPTYVHGESGILQPAFSLPYSERLTIAFGIPVEPIPADRTRYTQAQALTRIVRSRVAELKEGLLQTPR